MNIAICDDNPLIHTQLQSWLDTFFHSYHTKLPEISFFTTGDALLQSKISFDIVFLDVEMPGLNGIQVGRALKVQNEHVIIFIVTAFPDYLDDAMRFHVFRYLSKPLEKQRFFENMKDAMVLYHTCSSKVAVETKQGVHTLPCHEILCVEAVGKRTLIHTRSQVLESLQNITYWKEQLQSACFFQTHRSFIVNMEHISFFDDSVIFLAENPIRIYLTKRKYAKFKEAYLLYMESIR